MTAWRLNLLFWEWTIYEIQIKPSRHKDLENSANKYRQHILVPKFILRLQVTKLGKHLF